jgi:DinB superfamily
MMYQHDIDPMPEYFDRYIALADDVTYLDALQTSLAELDNLPKSDWEALGEQIYAPGKWTLKDLLQHLIDTERIFTYRVLAFSRNETQKMLSYDEDAYAKNADANRRTITELLDELKLLRQSTIALYQSFSKEMLLKSGKSFKGYYSVLSIAFMLAGHQRWHVTVANERYLPLLKAASPEL